MIFRPYRNWTPAPVRYLRTLPTSNLTKDKKAVLNFMLVEYMPPFVTHHIDNVV